MKNFPVVLLSIVIVLACFAVYRYTEIMSPVWTVTAAQESAIQLETDQHNAQVDVQAHRDRAQWWTSTLSSFSGLIFILALAVGGVYVWSIYDKRYESKLRAVDGTFALQTFKANGQLYVTDPNKAVFGVFGQDTRTGNLITDASMIGADRQLAYAATVQKTRTANAVTSGEGFKHIATGKYLSGALDKPERTLEYAQVAEDTGSIAPWQALTLQQAFAQSTKDNWLLGQNEHSACSFNVLDVVHTGLLGATKTGKTSSTALLMALNAKRAGMHVIALDGAGGIDWSPYSNLFEVYETDYGTIGDQLDQIVKLHDLRMKELKRAGKPSIDELDYTIPPVFVVLEEFGRTMQSYRAGNKKQYEITENALSILMRVSRKTGLHFLLIDQGMNGWSGEIKQNVKSYISYHLGGKQGYAFEAYNLQDLAPNGEFWCAGEVYKAWHTKPEIATLQKELQPAKFKLLTDTQYYSDYRSVDETVSSTANGLKTNRVSEVVLYPTQTQTVSNGFLSTEAVSDGLQTVSTVLTGRAINRQQKEMVLAVYKQTDSKTATCRQVWGRKDGTTWKWLHEILQAESEVMQ
jgi:hypothetical protein